MRSQFVGRVAWKEILSTLRDRRTLFSSILLPLVMIPLFLIGFPLVIGRAFGGEQEKRQTVGVVGLQYAPQTLKKALEADTPAAKGVDLIEVTDATKAVQDGKVDAAIVVPRDVPSNAGGTPVVIEVHYKQSSTKAQLVSSKITQAIGAYSSELVALKLKEVNLPPQTLTPVIAKPVNADTAAERASGIFAFLIPMFIMQWILVGGQATAIDATAGEKERGTLEALLVTPISRLEVVIGKLASVVAFSVMSTVFSMIGLVLTGLIAAVILPGTLGSSNTGGSAGGGNEFATAFGGNLEVSLDGFVQLLLVGLTVAVLVAGVLLAICIFARSFKEAQTYIAPLALVMVIPAVFLQFADFVSRGAGLYATPIVGSMIVILDVVKGVVNWSHAGTAIAVNLIVAGIAVMLALRNFSKEQVLFRN